MNSKLTKFFVILMAFTVIGCNTIKGAGQDLEAGGRGLEKVAERNKPASSSR